MSRPDPFIPLEEDRVSARKLGAIAAVAIAVGATAVALSSLLLAHETHPLRTSAAPSAAPTLVSGVRQTSIDHDDDGLRRRARQTRALDRWEWADRDAGVAHVPIARAMHMIVVRAAEVDGGAP